MVENQSAMVVTGGSWNTTEKNIKIGCQDSVGNEITGIRCEGCVLQLGSVLFSPDLDDLLYK